MLPTAGGNRAVAGVVAEDTGKAAGQEHLQGNQSAPEPDRACRACYTHIHRGCNPSAFDKT